MRHRVTLGSATPVFFSSDLVVSAHYSSKKIEVRLWPFDYDGLLVFSWTDPFAVSLPGDICPRHVMLLTHPVQHGIVPERNALPRQADAILSGYDEDISSIRDGFLWGISDPGFSLMRHVVTARSAKPVYCGAHDRRQFSPRPEYRFDTRAPNSFLEQARLSILSWNPGPRRGMEGAIEEHIAGKWHVIALQEATEFLEHESPSPSLTALVALSCLTVSTAIEDEECLFRFFFCCQHVHLCRH